jgi:type IV pilus assembly protein PilN
MIRINLLPVKTSRRQEEVRNELILTAMGGAVAVLLVVVLLVIQSAQVNRVEAENAKLQRDIEHKEEILREVEEMEKMQAELEKKLAVIATLKRNKSGPVMMLDQLSQATPEKLQLLSLNEKGGKVEFTGLAVSNEVISQFLSNLEKSPRFTDVFLNEIDQIEEGGVKLKNFSVSARLVNEKPAADASEKG